jgi:AdoMet-dependent rRNA methyltransferase SPB1
VAKEQGLRSRAAFKLSQINRKYPVLQKASAVLDLCAAPGGWTQIAARTCRSTTPIVAVDILPIRKLPYPNVTTLIGDITTEKTKSDIRHALKGVGVDVVLHDGAPNVGADYGKDAYEQNEIALHAVKTATQLLTPGGTFITKLYRSRDYAKFLYILQQLFADTPVAFKPAASRQQSAEIFLICRNYKAPVKLDSRMLDPKHVFEDVQGETTGGGSSTTTALSIFHKNHDKPQRKRGGYDHQHLDFAMRHMESVSSFINAVSLKQAIKILSVSTSLTFTCEQCKEEEDSCCEKSCSFYRHHPLTTPEIKECVSDLQVLNKSDFKNLLNWRTKMQQAVAAAESTKDQGSEDDGDSDSNDGSDDGSDDSEREEEEIQAEIAEMRRRRQRERKRRKKKERAAASKRRKQAALGMDLNAIDIPENEQVFSLATIGTKDALLAASEVNLDQITDEQIFGNSDDDKDVIIGGAEDGSDSDDDSATVNEDAKLARRELDLDEAYNHLPKQFAHLLPLLHSLHIGFEV